MISFGPDDLRDIDSDELAVWFRSPVTNLVLGRINSVAMTHFRNATELSDFLRAQAAQEIFEAILRLRRP